MKKKILIVEDDKDISRALVIRLGAAGYEVATAYDAVLAMSAATEQKPDLAILDVTMPGGSGFKVAERLRAEPATAGVPVIFITASKRPEFRERAAELGAVGYFEKPYEARELLDAIDTQLSTVRVA